MQKINTILIIALAVILTTIVIAGGNKGSFGAVADINGYSTCTSVTSSVASTTKNSIVTTNYSNRYILIQNQDASNAIYLTFADTTSTLYGYKLSAGQTYTLNNSNLYTGVITAYSTGTAIVVHTTICQ